MAKPDFTKIFAQNGMTMPLTDPQFLQGFGYLGDNPPTVEEFNWLFQEIWLRMQWLNQNAGFGRWQAEHIYAAGEICYSSALGDFKYMECTTPGTSSKSEPTWTAPGTSVTDGTAVWAVKDIRQGTSIGRIPALVDVGGGKAGLPAVSGKLLTDISGMPIGTPHPFLAKAAPPGWLAIDAGAIVSRAAYPDLWAFVQSSGMLISESDWQAQAAVQTSVGYYSTGDGSTTFRLPRMLDFPRGGIAADIGKYVRDSIILHDHVGVQPPTTPYSIQTGYGAATLDPKTGTVNNTVTRTGKTGDGETAPKHIVFLWCVKAFDVPVNQGTVDVTALANSIASKVNLTDFANSLSGNGWQKLPGGLIVQWGIVTTSGTGQTTITFPIAFPNTPLRTVATPGQGNITVGLASGTNTTQIITTYNAATGAITSTNLNYVIIGY